MTLNYFSTSYRLIRVSSVVALSYSLFGSFFLHLEHYEGNCVISYILCFLFVRPVRFVVKVWITLLSPKTLIWLNGSQQTVSAPVIIHMPMKSWTWRIRRGLLSSTKALELDLDSEWTVNQTKDMCKHCSHCWHCCVQHVVCDWTPTYGLLEVVWSWVDSIQHLRTTRTNTQ